MCSSGGVGESTGREADSKGAAPEEGVLQRAESQGRGRKLSAEDALRQRLAAEVLRKLRLATEAEQKEDRDIVCSEVFADITGDLNRAARDTTGSLYRRWYEVLAPYFCKAWNSSEALLAVCRRLWGQPFTAPIYTLLLHQWLLVHAEAGGEDQRLKHLNVLVSGARQLFIGDVETGNAAFAPLFAFMGEQVVLSPDPRRLDALPAPGRDAVMGLVASFLPYYASKQELLEALDRFPSPSSNSSSSAGSPGTSSGGSGSGSSSSSSGADFAVERIVDALSKEIRTEAGMLRYLRALMALHDSPHLATLRTATRVRLQGEIYLLAQPGGPRYAPRPVNRLALEALDGLFPHGRRTRRLINLAFRFLHPQEWPWFWWDFLRACARAMWAWLLAACAAVTAACARLVRPLRQRRAARQHGWGATQRRL